MRKFLTVICVIISSSIYSQKTIPNVNLKTLDGKSVNIEDEVSKDKITVLSFWATWCVPCINELDIISEVYEDWQDETEVEIIAISIDDARTQKRVKPLINGKDWDYKILIDKNQELKRALNISVIPHVIILKGSEILYRHTGYAPGAENELYKKIKEFSK
ncbi:TlpA family protein disulfide reductase [Polaribacter pectinis]|uniref:TlpA family protein disulfide reductase n=1 Tax=Polaribacter pectinis TaxID=2738844 RepID=A0A7G9LBR0_9FLAO|nr:TlpA disulfide reductase family protein [Polaribacter pectinis]QNM86059.1 TlpA family protein disulfide reductase [Polaribacter pectinis]